MGKGVENLSMERIKLDEVTVRLRRNLVVSSFLIIIIKGFGIEVAKVAGGGIELTNLTTENFLLILMAILLYHFVAFGVRVVITHALFSRGSAEIRPGFLRSFDMGIFPRVWRCR